MIISRELRIDRIGKPALLAHLAKETCRKNAAAQNMVDDRRGDEVRVFAGYPLAAETDCRLRHVDRGDMPRAGTGESGGRDRNETGLIGQLAKDIVEMAGERLRVDRADGGDLEIVSR